MNPIKLVILVAVVFGAYSAGGVIFDITFAGTPASASASNKTLFSLGWMVWTGVAFAIFGGIAAAILGWLKK